MKRILSIVLIVALMLTMITPVYADAPVQDDLVGHWSESIMREWIGEGLISGYDGDRYKPNAAITRAEFCTLLNNVIGLTATENAVVFKDVLPSDWFYQTIKNTASNGLVSGYEDGSFYPNKPIKREEAAVVVKKILSQNVASQSISLNHFKDYNEISTWSKEAVGTLVDKGYLNGYPDGTFRAKQSITRGEAVAMLGKVFGKIFNDKGVYKGEKDVTYGNVTIASADVTLEDMMVRGDLYIAESVGEGDVTLNNVTVEGDIIVKGGGENSIHFNNSNVLGSLLVNKANNKIRIIASGTTRVNVTYLASGALLVEDELAAEGFNNVILDAETIEGLEIELVGSFNTVEALTEGFKINLPEKSSIQQLNINDKAVGFDVAGKGEIKAASVNANGSHIDVNVEKMTVGEKAIGVTANGKEMATGINTDNPQAGGITGDTTGPSSGGGSSSSDSKEDSKEDSKVDDKKDPAPLAVLTLSGASVNMTMTQLLTVTATVQYTTSSMVNANVIWVSQSPEMVTVKKNGSEVSNTGTQMVIENQLKASSTTSSAIVTVYVVKDPLLSDPLVSSNVITLKTVTAKISEDTVPPVKDDLVVKAIKAASAKTFTVDFDRAVTDADKIIFTVSRVNSPVTVTTVWNEAKDQATLATASNLAEGTFDVAVIADAKEVAKESITITAQNVSKIEFTSDSVAVEKSDLNGDGYVNGYVTYKTYDQYDNDITSSYLSDKITFTTDVGDVVAQNGFITISPSSESLLELQEISITAYDATSKVLSTVTLSISSTVGTLKSFTLGSVEDLHLAEDDLTSIFYLPYTAIDMGGNETKNYDLIISDLIDGDTTTPGINLSVSLSSHVSATISRDPNDFNKAVIEIKAKNSILALNTDMSVSITATYTGGKSTVQTLFLRAKALDSITLLEPSETIAAGETPTIEFEAYDQFGNRITRYDEISAEVSLTNLILLENTDGSAKLKTMTPLMKGTTTLAAAAVRSRKVSFLTLNVQATAVPAKLVLDDSDIIYAMEVGATQELWLDEDDMIMVYDQYDRQISSDDIDKLFGGNTSTSYKYRVEVTATGATGIETVNLETAGSYSLLTAPETEGSDIITISLIQYGQGVDRNISIIQLPLTYIKTSDITGYTISKEDKVIYASVATSTSAVTARDSRYDAEIEVYGKTDSGVKVLLAGAPIQNAYVSNTNDFVVVSTGGAYDVVRVNAIKPADGATSAETDLIIDIFQNGKVTPITTKITSSTVEPEASSITTISAENDDDSATRAQINGKYLVDFDASGAYTSAASFKFRIIDQYGSRAMSFASFSVDKVEKAFGTSTSTDGITISPEGQIFINDYNIVGNSYWITASTANGLKKTVRLRIID